MDKLRVFRRFGFEGPRDGFSRERLPVHIQVVVGEMKIRKGTKNLMRFEVWRIEITFWGAMNHASEGSLKKGCSRERSSGKTGESVKDDVGGPSLPSHPRLLKSDAFTSMVA